MRWCEAPHRSHWGRSRSHGPGTIAKEEQRHDGGEKGCWKFCHDKMQKKKPYSHPLSPKLSEIHINLKKPPSYCPLLLAHWGTSSLRKEKSEKLMLPWTSWVCRWATVGMTWQDLQLPSARLQNWTAFLWIQWSVLIFPSTTLELTWEEQHTCATSNLSPFLIVNHTLWSLASSSPVNRRQQHHVGLAPLKRLRRDLVQSTDFPVTAILISIDLDMSLIWRWPNDLKQKNISNQSNMQDLEISGGWKHWTSLSHPILTWPSQFGSPVRPSG